MKRVIRLFCVFCAIAIASASLLACGGGSYDPDTMMFIGATGPLTGGEASYGISVQRGATVAVEEINAAGGLNGYTFYFDMRDDQAQATPAANAYTSLIEAGMQVSLGSVTSASCLAFANEAKKDNLFFITPSASAAEVIKEDNAYRICFDDPDQGRISAETLAEKYTKIGAIYDSSDTYSKGIFDSFKAEIQKYENVTLTEASFLEGAVDFNQQVTNLKNAGCEVVYLPIYYTEANLIIRNAVTTQGWQPDFFGCDGLDGLKALIEQNGFIDTVEGEISYMTAFDAAATDEKTKKFVDDYKAKYNETPDQFAADAYDAVYVLYEAMKEANVTDATISVSDLCEILKSTISGEGFVFTGTTGTMTWDASGAPDKEPVIVALT